MCAAVPDVDATIARVVDDRIGSHEHAHLVAIGRASARVETALMLAPFDDVVLHADTVELYGKVSETAVTDDGRCLVTLVYSTVAGTSVDQLMARSAPVVA
jgi:hypothetical protein